MKMTETTPNLIEKLKGGLQPTVKVFGESKSVQILSGVFFLQLVIAGSLLWKSNSQAQFAPTTQLVSIDPSTIDEVVIRDGENSVSLFRADEQWRMNDEHETQAATDDVEKLLSSLDDLKPGLPVTSTRAAHDQLEVAEDNYQRHLTLKSGNDTIVDLYMGTSPGFRKSHVRQVDQDEVYSARLNTFDVPVDHDDWLDKTLLSFDSINGIQAGEIDLTLENDQWSITSPEDRRETHGLDKSSVDSVVSQLGALRINGFAQPLKVDETPDAASDSEATEASEPEKLLTHTITIVQNDSPVTLILSKLGNNATIERSDVAGLFSLPIATFEALTTEAIEQLLVTKSTDEESEDSQPQG